MVEEPVGGSDFENSLPLLLVSVGPLLISSYVFNFNNFNLSICFLEAARPFQALPRKAGYTIF